jgi:hypothetical protein
MTFISVDGSAFFYSFLSIYSHLTHVNFINPESTWFVSREVTLKAQSVLQCYNTLLSMQTNDFQSLLEIE